MQTLKLLLAVVNCRCESWRVEFPNYLQSITGLKKVGEN